MIGRVEVADLQTTLIESQESDLEFIMQMERDPENSPFVRQWSEEQHLEAMSDDNVAHLVVCREPDRHVVGFVILRGLTDPDNSIEFKRLVINEKGSGFGRDAVQLIKKFAFEHSRAHRLWLEVVESNERAFQLYRTEGFVLEGLHREAFKREDKYVTFRMMSMLANEYTREYGDMQPD